MPSLWTVLREWGRLGCIGFGGPPTHIALLRQLCVERRGWLDAREFEDAVAACNLLPGPASTQLAIFCAWRVRGPAGALLGGVAFIVPGLVVILALAALFRFTSVGLRLRASAFNPYAARLLGVRVGRVLTLGWALAGLIGALAGLLVSPDTFLYPSSMDSIFVLGFTAAVIGGLDSPVGAIVGGLILGVVLNYVGGYLGSNLVPIFGLVALMAVLLIRPSGLFSVTHERRV